MTIDDYSTFVQETCGVESGYDRLLLGSLGLAGETGEVCDYVKKVMFHTHDFDVPHLIEELGDVLWYLTLIAASQHYSLTEVLERNVEKLHARYPHGFDAERSKNREQSA